MVHAEAFLLVHRHRVINLSTDAVRLQILFQGISSPISLNSDHELVENMPMCLGVGMKYHIIMGDAVSREKSLVSARILTPSFRPCREIGKFHPKESGLKRVQSEVATDNLMIIFGLRTMASEQIALLSQNRVIGNDHAAVTEATEIF
jgi:hypothetical protein